MDAEDMTYNEAREYISSLSPRGIVPGLESIKALCGALGSPQKRFGAVHIAGTNGKGSVGAFLQAVLTEAGLKIGRFASPAVGGYLETFTINGVPINESLYAECAKKVMTAAAELESKGIYPTSFEAETAIAFLLFSELGVDYALIECGMGGLMDSTNVIPPPAAAIITSIALDHTRFLGDTISEIAVQKCGIIKDGTNVISSLQCDEAANVIRRECKNHHAHLTEAADVKNIKYGAHVTVFDFDGRPYEIPLRGSYQPYNAAAAIAAARLLGIDEKTIRRGLKNTVWHYRFERIGKYILDGAHNEDAARQLADSIKEYLPNKRIAYICGCFRDKDFYSIARRTAPYAAAVYCVTPPTDRGLDNETLRRTFSDCGAAAYSCGCLEDAVKAADCYDAVVIFGTLSILGKARQLIERIITDATMQ